ncbi:MAG: efflux RND transporter periplasmic adaptor subunit [Acidobacteria bacterium]|nr:efflux RND transporter periplasmic adaptor subunit [Acidobacteriota bacterium]
MMKTHDIARLSAIRLNADATVLGAITLGVALACAGCSRTRAADNSAGASPPAVAVAKVSRGDLTQTLTLAAEFRPFQEIDVHAKIAGYVKSISVDVGDRVKAGQLLAVLEIPELLDEMRQDDAAVRRNGEEIRRSKADLERAESAHQMAHLASTRLAAVIKDRPNLVAQQDVDDATARDRMAEAQVATAQAALASAEQQLEVSKATQNKTQTLFAYGRITAPFDGVITHRYADTGAMIQAGTASQTQTMPVVRLSENRLLRLTIPVPESAVTRIRLGEPVDVRVQALGRTFPGKIARFTERLNADTRTMETEVDVANPALELIPGMYAYADITLDRISGALVVPVQALDRDERRTSVMVVNGGKTEHRDVTVGLELPDRVEVTSGLREDELVVVGSRSQLKAGTTVTPKTGGAAPAEGKP